MDLDEARALLREEEARLRALSYDELLARYSEPHAETKRGASGAAYQLETEAFFDDRESRNLRVMIAIDDGGLRSLKPLTADFIVALDGSFVGE